MSILVADDELAVLEELCAALEAEGHRVLRAGDGSDAFRILSSQPCSVVVCDEDMPGMNGKQLAEAMRADARFARLPIIMMVDAFARARHDADPIHPDVMILHKPVVLPQLIGLVELCAPRPE
jgi:two-component system, chemotaxis family, sensor histidine kinase and response regulator PixL